MLIGIRNRAMYTDPVLDPVFRSTTHRHDSTEDYFTADLTTGVIGCTEQYQFCNGHKCSSPSALYSITDDFAANALKYNAVQMAAFKTLMRIAYTSRIFSIQFMIGDDILLAKDSLYGYTGMSMGLAANQWQIEVQNMHNISMAVLQQAVLAHAAPMNPRLGQGANASHYWDWIVPETSPAQAAVCQNQKIRSQNYLSFNVLGLTLVLVAGICVISLGSCAPWVADYRRHKVLRGRPLVDDEKRRALQRLSGLALADYRTKEWSFSDPLHLHRLALEEHGIAPWTITNNIPIPVEQDKEFRIPWLMKNHGVTFWLDNRSEPDFPEKSFQFRDKDSS
jgi:hypothetical protein